MTEVPAPPSIPTALIFVMCFSLLFSIFYPDGHSHFEFLMGFIVIFLYNFYWILGICWLVYEKVFSLYPWLVLNTDSSCISLWSVDIIGLYHHYQLSVLFLMNFPIRDIVLESINKLSWIPICYSNVTLWSVCMHVCRHMYVYRSGGQRSALGVSPQVPSTLVFCLLEFWGRGWHSLSMAWSLLI